YAYDFVMDEAGVILEEENAPSEAEGTRKKSRRGKRAKGLSSYTVEALSKMLDEVLSEENYERAAEIRDEIRRREEAS
ncbi:MAG: UvrB/UvrC motif-containing protein, partial [Lewinella sp.]|nr:UvrB/UvrC motif-containing protein [Lewinella sp.]